MSRLTFVGVLDPYLSMREVTDLLNGASGGKSAWTADKTRLCLQSANALTTMPTAEPETGSAPTKRRLLYTTRELLAARVRPLYETILKALPQEEFAKYLPPDGAT